MTLVEYALSTAVMVWLAIFGVVFSLAMFAMAIGAYDDLCPELQMRRIEYVFPARPVACWLAGPAEGAR